MPRRWEYRIELVNVADLNAMVLELNELGKTRWELVQILRDIGASPSGTFALLKRPT